MNGFQSRPSNPHHRVAGMPKLLHLDERQHPMFQVEMHVRCRVPLLKIVPLDAVFPKF